MNTANRWDVIYTGTSPFRTLTLQPQLQRLPLGLYLIALVLPVVEGVDDRDVTALITGIYACLEMYEPSKSNQT